MDEGKSKSRHNLRSSLKKSSRNPFGSLDVSDEGEDITLPPPPRRVSFAASSTVKPFVNDPEKNTIWDNTYEEEINHTDSNNVLSLDSHSNIQEIQRVNINFNQSLVHLGATLKDCSESNMELTNCVPTQIKSTAGENMELTCMWKNKIIDNNRVIANKNAKDMLQMSANCTQIQEVDMSLTNCGFAIANKENIQLPMAVVSHNDQVLPHSRKKTLMRQKQIEHFADKSLLTKTIKDPLDMELTCKFNSELDEPMEIDETVKTNKNSSVYQECDMSMTCKFNNIIINKGNVFPSGNDSDMEFTCTFPPKNVSSVKNHQTPHYCPQNNTELQKTSHFNQAEADMEFTCQFPDKSIDLQKVGRNAGIKSSNVNQTEADMEITCQFSERQIILQKTQKIADLDSTCFPTKVVKEKNMMGNISEAEPADVNQSSVDMEFTCKFSQNIVQQMHQNDAPKLIEQSNANLSISQIPHKTVCLPESVSLAKNGLSKTCQLSSDMELTCVLPQKETEVKSGANKSTITVASPKLGLLNVNHSIGDKKLACQSAQDNANSFNAEFKLTSELPKIALKSVEIYSDDATFNMNFTCKTLLMENSSSEKYNEVNSIAHTSSVHKPKLEIEDTINVSLPELHMEPKNDTFKVPKERPLKVKEFGNIPVAIDSTDLSIDHSTKDIMINNVNEPEIVRQECATPPKVIYSEPMKVAKPSMTMLDFSSGLSSGKKPFNFSSLTSIDGTQQLIEATFSKFTDKLDELIENESGFLLIDNTIDEHQAVGNSFDRNSHFNSSSVRVQRMLDNIQNKIVKYEKPQFDFDSCHRLIQENQNLLDKVKHYLENCKSPEPQSSSLDEKVRKLSLANSSYNSNTSDTVSEDADDDMNNGCVAVNEPKSLRERILEVFNNVEEHVLKLQYNEENYYIFSAFSQSAWFAVDFHSEDGRVIEIKTIVGLKKHSTSLYASVHKFVVDCICKKLEMCNLKSSLGSYFDVLSLLDHVIIITESSLEFCMEFIDVNRQYITLKMEPDGQVSFEILVTSPPILWTVQFKMASIDNIDQNSLKVTSKWGIIHEEHLKTILRNTKPGLDCIRRFVESVKEYFGRVQFMKLRSKELNKPAEIV